MSSDWKIRVFMLRNPAALQHMEPESDGNVLRAKLDVLMSDVIGVVGAFPSAELMTSYENMSNGFVPPNESVFLTFNPEVNSCQTVVDWITRLLMPDHPDFRKRGVTFSEWAAVDVLVAEVVGNKVIRAVQLNQVFPKSAIADGSNVGEFHCTRIWGDPITVQAQERVDKETVVIEGDEFIEIAQYEGEDMTRYTLSWKDFVNIGQVGAGVPLYAKKADVDAFRERMQDRIRTTKLEPLVPSTVMDKDRLDRAT